MGSTGIRKVFFFDYFHYKTANSCFDNTTTVVWQSPAANAWNLWDTVFGSSEAIGSNYMVPQAVAGASSYILCVETNLAASGIRTISIDWAMHYNSQAIDAGIYFFANATNLTIDSYRIKQTSTHIVIERLDGAGAVAWTNSIASVPGAGWNFYRIHFYPVDFELGDGETLASCAGQFLIEAGTAHNDKPQLGGFVDPAPRTTGAYHGIYQGSGSQPKVGEYCIGEDFYAMAKKLYVKQSLWAGAVARCFLRRGDYVEWGLWDKGDVIQIWAWDVDENEDYYEYLDFTGELVFHWDISQGYQSAEEICLIMTSFDRRLGIPYDTSGAAGTLSDHIDQYMEEIGGNHWGGMTNTFGIPRWVNRQFIKAATVAVTAGRTFKGYSMGQIIKHLALVEDFYTYMTPESAFKVTDIWRDKTAITIDTGNGDSRYLSHKAFPDDKLAMVNEAYVYRSASTQRTISDAASKASHGTRTGRYGKFIDIQIIDNAEADGIAQTLVNNHHEDITVIGIRFLARHIALRPGDLISLSCPQMRIGGDYETAHALWVPETYAVIEKYWDNIKNQVFIKFSPVWDDGGNSKGYQDPQPMVKHMQREIYKQTGIANANHL